MSKRILACMFLFLVLTGCAKKRSEIVAPDSVIEDDGVVIGVYNYKSFKPFLEQEDNMIHVINFWATWCKPCVKELPYFELIGRHYSNKKVKVTLVSLDLPSQVTSKLIPFIKRRKLESEVMLLDDVDANSWIAQVDKNWSGAIPATLIYKGSTKRFYEQSFTYNELEKEVKKMLN